MAQGIAGEHLEAGSVQEQPRVGFVEEVVGVER